MIEEKSDNMLSKENEVMTRADLVIDDMEQRELGKTDEAPRRDSVLQNDNKTINDLLAEVESAMQSIENIRDQRVTVDKDIK
jgi:hypothetical protein